MGFLHSIGIAELEKQQNSQALTLPIFHTLVKPILLNKHLGIDLLESKDGDFEDKIRESFSVLSDYRQILEIVTQDREKCGV